MVVRLVRRWSRHKLLLMRLRFRVVLIKTKTKNEQTYSVCRNTKTAAIKAKSSTTCSIKTKIWMTAHIILLLVVKRMRLRTFSWIRVRMSSEVIWGWLINKNLMSEPQRWLMINRNSLWQLKTRIENWRRNWVRMKSKSIKSAWPTQSLTQGQLLLAHVIVNRLNSRISRIISSYSSTHWAMAVAMVEKWECYRSSNPSGMVPLVPHRTRWPVMS